MTRARPDSVLPMLVPALWRTLVAWCEEHAEANIFHLHANRMIEMLVRRGDDKTHKNVFTKSKIISRFSSLALPVSVNCGSICLLRRVFGLCDDLEIIENLSEQIVSEKSFFV